jgi:hypothetical protein
MSLIVALIPLAILMTIAFGYVQYLVGQGR